MPPTVAGRTLTGMSTTIDTATTHVGPVSPRRRGHLWRSRWAAIGAAVAVTLGGGTLHLAGATDSEPSSIISITPTRILDTRDPVDLGLAGPFVSAVGQDLQVTGSVATPTGPQTVVPDGATGVLLNVTVVQPTAAGFISVRPSGTPGPPETSSLNFEAGDITPNAVFVALPTSGPNAGHVEITYDAFGTAGPTTDVLGDVVGYTMENPDVYTKAEADALFLTDVDAYTKAEADEAFGSHFAVVSANGTLNRGSDSVVSATRFADPGSYEVIFDRDISQCAYQVSAGSTTATAGPQPHYALVGNRQGNAANGVAVFMKNLNGAASNLAFHLTVHC
jgi:hypothetical protein